MLLTAILVIVAFAAGVAGGRKYPTVLAAAQAEFHFAQAEASRVSAVVTKKLNGIP